MVVKELYLIEKNLMTKRNGARQGAVEEVVERAQEGGQGGGLAPLAQQAAHTLHLQLVKAFQPPGCSGGFILVRVTGARWWMAFAHCQKRQEQSHKNRKSLETPSVNFCGCKFFMLGGRSGRVSAGSR